MTADAALAPVRRPKRRLSGLERRENVEGWLFAMPFIAGFALFTIIPMVLSLYMGFTEWDMISSPKWLGFGNYRKLFTDDLFWTSLWNTVFLAGLGIPVGMFFSLMVAFALNVKTRFTTLYRTLYFLPSQIPGVANAVLWALLFNSQFGVFNQLLAKVGMGPINFLFNKHTVKPSLVFMGLWGVGGGMMIYLAGLQNIPSELYEAAEIDGAGIWQRLRHITLPLLSPVIFFNLVMSIIGSFQGGFTTTYIMTNGGPANYSLVTMLYIYRQAFNYLHMGYASAFAWVIFAIILAFTAMQFRMATRWVFYETSGR